MSDNGAKPGSIFKRAFSVILSLAILIAIDQYAKAMAVSRLKDGGPFSLLPGILELRYVENTGAAFGILQGRSGIFFVIAIVVSAVLFKHLSFTVISLTEKDVEIKCFRCLFKNYFQFF